VRAYNGRSSRWRQAALRQKAGRITSAGMTKEVAFAAREGAIGDSPYLAPMIGERARSATVKFTPRESA
jgi:hypothetical protein